MATYIELRGLFNDDVLVNKVTVATIISVDAILNGTPTINDRAYAAKVYGNPREEAEKVLMSVLAANASLTVSQISSATDAAIQTKVDLIVPILIDALAGV